MAIISKPYIIARDRVNITKRFYQTEENHFCNNNIFFENDEDVTLNYGVIYGYNSEQFIYSSDELTFTPGYLFEISTIEIIEALSGILFSIVNEATVGPINRTHYKLIANKTFNEVKDILTTSEVKRLHRPIIFFKDFSNKFCWLITSTKYSEKNIFKYNFYGNEYVENFLILPEYELFGEYYDDYCYLVAIKNNEIKLEKRSFSDFSINSQILISNSTYIFNHTNCRKCLTQTPYFIIHETDNLQSPSFNKAYLLNLLNGDFIELTNCETNEFEEVHCIYELSNYFYGVREYNSNLEIYRSTSINNLFDSSNLICSRSFNGYCSQSLIRFINGEFYCFFFNTFLNSLGVFKFDIIDKIASKITYLDKIKKFNFIFSNNSKDWHFSIDDEDIIRSCINDINYDVSELDTFRVLSQEVNYQIPACNSFGIFKNDKNKFRYSEKLKSHIQIVDEIKYESQKLRIFYPNITTLRKTKLLQSFIEAYQIKDKNPFLSIASKEGNNHIWICINRDGYIFIDKIEKTKLHNLGNIYYHEQKYDPLYLSSLARTIGKGTDSRIIYNEKTDEIYLTYFFNNLYLSRKWYFDTDIREIERKFIDDGLIDLIQLEGDSTIAAAKLSPMSLANSQGYRNLEKTNIKKNMYTVEDIGEIYKNFNISINFIRENTEDVLLASYKFERNIDVNNLKDRCIRVLYFEFYYKAVENLDMIPDVNLRDFSTNNDIAFQYKIKPLDNMIIFCENLSNPPKDICHVNLRIPIKYENNVYYANKIIYALPVFGIFSDPNLTIMVNKVKGTLFNTGILLAPIAFKKEEIFMNNTAGSLVGNLMMVSDPIIYKYVIEHTIPNEYVSIDLINKKGYLDHKIINYFSNLNLIEDKINRIKKAISKKKLSYKLKTYKNKVVF